MAGTESGGKQAAQTNVNLYGADFYPRIGALGGSKSRGGGFTGKPDIASKWGAVGGAISRRGDTPKLSKKQVSDIRKRLLEEQSQMQTSKLSARFGKRRSW
jgi:hypothetical protein